MSTPRPPIRHWTDAYLGLKQHLEELRGFVELNPNTTAAVRWPRTVSEDVLVLAAVFDRHLHDAPADVGLASQWAACLADVERYAYPAPLRRYPESRRFWAGVLAVCVHLDRAGAPLPDGAFWDALFQGLDHSVAALVRNADIPLPSDRFVADWRRLLTQRGPDDRYPFRFAGLRIPSLTNGDAVQLAIEWTNRLAEMLQTHPGALVEVQAAWNLRLDAVKVATHGAPAEARFAGTDTFWPGVSALAFAMDRVVAPTAPMDPLIVALMKTFNRVGATLEDIPGMLGRGAEAIASEAGELLGDVAGGAGKIVGSAGRGFFGEFLTPLLVVGGVLGVYLVTRHHDGGAAPAAAA